MLVTAMDHTHNQRTLNMGMLAARNDMAPAYLDLASVHEHHSYMANPHLMHQHQINHGHYIDDNLQEDQYDLSGQSVSPKNNQKPSLYKTELCKRFTEFGSCRYGGKCQFAHGMQELRHVLRHPKYKTTKCKSYWGSGHCPYGSRCRFIHEEEVFAPPPKSGPSMYGFNDGMITQTNEISPTSRAHFAFMESSSYSNEIPLPPSNPQTMNGHNTELGLLRTVSQPSGPTWMHSQSDYSSNAFTPKPLDSKGSIGSKKMPLSNLEHSNAGNSEYSGLQDAIEVLMKFSQNFGDDVKPVGSKPTETSSNIMNSPVKSEFVSSLQGDELWKDFASVSLSNDRKINETKIISPSNVLESGDEDGSRLSFFSKFS